MRYTVHDKESQEDSDIEISRDGTVAILYNESSKKTHHTKICVDADLNVLIESVVNGVHSTMSCPLYTLFDIENLARCIRDAGSNYGSKAKISKVLVE